MLPSAGVYSFQDNLDVLFLEYPSQPRGHREQVPHLSAFTGLVSTPLPMSACAWRSGALGGGASKCPEVPEEELGQASACHLLR